MKTESLVSWRRRDVVCVEHIIPWTSGRSAPPTKQRWYRLPVRAPRPAIYALVPATTAPLISRPVQSARSGTRVRLDGRCSWIAECRAMNSSTSNDQTGAECCAAGKVTVGPAASHWSCVTHGLRDTSGHIKRREDGRPAGWRTGGRAAGDDTTERYGCPLDRQSPSP